MLGRCVARTRVAISRASGVSASGLRKFNINAITRVPGTHIRARMYSMRRISPEDVETVKAKRTAVDNKIFNIPEHIESKLGRNLHKTPRHPLNTIKNLIQTYFGSKYATASNLKFRAYDDLSPIVSVKQNFDDLLTPMDHVTRKPTDTYFLDNDTLLRCHTSAHQVDLLRDREGDIMLCSGDVYRRDEIDTSHFPVFHQMEGLRIFEDTELAKRPQGVSEEEYILEDMKKAIEGMIHELFGKVEMRWIDAYFPFTVPSLELEIFYNEKWLEVLGCGVIQQKIMETAGHGTKKGWAFGFGLERFAMVLFDVPDIRLFWSEDSRFLNQFEDGKIVKFKPFSSKPTCYKDISFWVPPEYHENNFYELVRTVAGDIVEDVSLVDKFTHPKKGQTSYCYRLNYRSMDRTLTNDEINVLQEKVKAACVSDLAVQLR